MSITLYGMGHSRSFRCLWALEEAELDFDFVALDLSSQASDGAKSADYLALNVQGKVPTLVHQPTGGSSEEKFVLTESAAILNYVDAISGAQLIPTNSQQRARYDELAFFILAELEQPLWTTGKHKFAIPEAQRVPEVLNTAKWEFAKAINALDSLCQIDSSSNDKPSDEQLSYVLEDRFTMADILLAQTLNWADRFKFDVPEKYLRYRDTHYARAAAKRATARFE